MHVLQVEVGCPGAMGGGGGAITIAPQGRGTPIGLHEPTTQARAPLHQAPQ